MNTYEKEAIGNIVIIRNLIFQDSRTNIKELDHAWKTGRPCIIIYSDNEYDYLLPIKSHIKNEKYKHCHFTLNEDQFLHKQISRYGNYNLKIRNKKQTKGIVNLQTVYKIPISWHDETGKITFDTYKDIIKKLKEYHQKENLDEIIVNAQKLEVDKMNISNKWKDYECIKTGDGEKLERWGNIILNRPDPQIIWNKKNTWNNYDGYYHRSTTGGGYWEFKKKLPEYWTVNYNELTFKVSPTNFKHTGIFPEQAANWDFISEKVKEYMKNHNEMHVLNLFAYTGCATMAASSSGATEVVHVDASKGINEWAKENMKLCHLEDHTIRFITEDVIKFLEREIRRGRKYQGIIMDPPSYGRGPNKEVWKFENDFSTLLSKVKEVLDEDFSFLLISSYTTGTSHISLENILKLEFPNNKIETGENTLPVTEDNLILPCGIYAKVTKA